MDVNAALEQARAAYKHWLGGERGDKDMEVFGDLAGAFHILDVWLSNRGYLPADWAEGRVIRTAPPLANERERGRAELAQARDIMQRIEGEP